MAWDIDKKVLVFEIRSACPLDELNIDRAAAEGTVHLRDMSNGPQQGEGPHT